MNSKNSQKSQFLVVKDTFKDIFMVLNFWVKKVKEKFYGLYVFGIYVMIIIAFAFGYNSIYQTNPNNFLISNHDLDQNIKNQSIADQKQDSASILKDLNVKKMEMDRLKSANNALNQFDKDSTSLLIFNNIRPDSIIYFGRKSFSLRLIKKNTIGYLIQPVFENQNYRYEVKTNYRKLSYYFSDDNHTINMSIVVKNKKQNKLIYFDQFFYRSPERRNNRKYIDIKIFYARAIWLQNDWIKDRIFEREKEYQDLKDRQNTITTQLRDSNHYLSFWDFLYFSTITQSSTGYGDILPNSRFVRMTVTFQIIAGLFVLGILINSKSKDK